MRISIVLLVILALAGGGYTMYWNKKAEDFRQMFISSSEAVNANAKEATKTLPLFHFENVSVTGFPAAMVLEVSKPVINIPMSTIIKKSNPDAPPAPYEWVEEISYGDKFTLTGNVMGNSYTFTANGDRTHRALVDGKPRHTLIASSSTPLVCHLSVEKAKGGAMWTMQPIFSDPQTFLNTFRSFDCGVQGSEFKDSTGASLYTYDRLFVSLSNEAAEGANRKLALQADFHSAKFTPAFDATYKDYMVMAYTLMGQQKILEKLPVVWSEYGDQSLKIDMAYDGPTEKQSVADPAMAVHFDVNALNVNSSLYNMNIESHISSIPQGTDRAVSIAVHSTSDATERYDQLLKQIVSGVVSSLSDPAGKTPEELKLAQTIKSIGVSPDEIAAAVTPQSHALGKTAFDLDLNVKAPTQRGAFMKQGALTLDSLNWTSTPYGIKIKGSASAGAEGSKLPVADLTLNCIACDDFIGDFGGYIMRVEALFDKAGKVSQPYLTKDLLEGVKQFLHGVAENATAKDLLVHLAFKDTLTVSGKQLPEVMALYMSTIAPRMPQMSPSAGAGMGGAGSDELAPVPGQQ